jgi:hypothetical protein
MEITTRILVIYLKNVQKIYESSSDNKYKENYKFCTFFWKNGPNLKKYIPIQTKSEVVIIIVLSLKVCNIFRKFQ